MRPADCALVVTVPLDRAEFMADIHAGTDFLDQFRARQRTRLLEVLWTVYESSVASAATIIARARRRGVTVCTRSGLADFTRCLEQHAVVTLVAHWRSARFRASEIDDPAAVRRLLFPEEAARSGAQPPTADGIAEALNRRLEFDLVRRAQCRVDDSGGAAMETRRQYALWQARQDTQNRLGSAVRRGGPGVEFVGGVVDVEKLVAAIPATFSGVLDLTVCNSTLLAEEIRRRRRSGLVIANAFPATLDTRMDFYDAAMRLVQHEGVSYQDAVFMVRSRLRRSS
jgi:hypothetical protein